MKKTRRIKVFLGGYVNSQNAQNNNCRSLSEHLDKEIFEVWTMVTWHSYPKDNDFTKVPGVHYIYDTPSHLTEKLHLPFWLFAWMAYAKGILKCDVAYLPKGEYVRFCQFMARLRGCKLFTTLEGVLPESYFSVRKDLDRDKYIHNLKRFQNLFAITRFIADRESKDKSLEFRDKVLYLGVESDTFAYLGGRHSELHNIVFVGFNTIHKHAIEVLKMAEVFPRVNFHIVGGNALEGGVTVEGYIANHRIENCTYHGPLDHRHLSELLKTMDLMFFPSRSEGFPKVMLETACAGVPTLCYGDYGADEWITSGKNGFVVNTFDEAKSVIQDLLDHPEKLQPLSDAAVELGRRFDWKVLVRSWEDEIEKLARGE